MITSVNPNDAAIHGSGEYNFCSSLDGRVAHSGMLIRLWLEAAFCLELSNRWEMGMSKILGKHLKKVWF